MTTTSQLMDDVTTGYDIRVVRKSTNDRVVSVVDSRRQPLREFVMNEDEYESVMASFVDALVARSGDDVEVKTGIDFYGKQWAEVKSGLFGRHKAKLGLSPRHLSLLEDRLQRKRLAT